MGNGHAAQRLAGGKQASCRRRGGEGCCCSCSCARQTLRVTLRAGKQDSEVRRPGDCADSWAVDALRRCGAWEQWQDADGGAGEAAGADGRVLQSRWQRQRRRGGQTGGLCAAASCGGIVKAGRVLDFDFFDSIASVPRSAGDRRVRCRLSAEWAPRSQRLGPSVDAPTPRRPDQHPSPIHHPIADRAAPLPPSRPATATCYQRPAAYLPFALAALLQSPLQRRAVKLPVRYEHHEQSMSLPARCGPGSAAPLDAPCMLKPTSFLATCSFLHRRPRVAGP